MTKWRNLRIFTIYRMQGPFNIFLGHLGVKLKDVWNEIFDNMLCVTLCTLAATPGVTSVENGASPAENLLLLKLLRFVGIFSQGWKGIRGLALALLKLCIGALPVKLGLFNKRTRWCCQRARRRSVYYGQCIMCAVYYGRWKSGA